ncbi:MAG: hypothetical protein H6739_32810 [Alphaproteobacteria bacterium]|nr:hypothetical protein [Alphaproteobacteria bacterium]
MRWAPLLLLMGLTACYTEPEYDEDYDEVFCEHMLSCSDAAVKEVLPYGDVDECVDYRGALILDEDAEAPICAFDPSAARDCIREMRQMSCEAFEGSDYPSACDRVCAADED